MTFQHAFDRVKRVCMAAAVMMVMAMLFMVSLVLPTTLPTHATAGAGQFFAMDTAVAAENSSDKDSWTAVAELISTDLNAGVESLNAGDPTSAASAFQRAYNVDYVASNMTVAAGQYADATTAQSVKSELMALTTDVYNSAKQAEIPSRVSAVQTQIASLAAALDANAQLANPRDFAAERAKKIAEERKKLDAAKVRKNTGRGSRTWSDVAVEMTAILDKAQTAATTGDDGRKGAALVNEAYYQHYEKLGFEKTVMSAISGARVSEVENQFKETRKSMVGGKSEAEIKRNVQTLKSMIVTDAKVLDGGAAAKVNPFVSFVTSSFGQAFIILLREGLEAILVVAAVIAYLAKQGYKRMLKYIYLGVVGGLIASAIMAALLTFIFKAAGSHQEVFEGVTALIAMVMLLYTSNWMLSKTDHEAWSAYVDEKTKQSISNGSVMSLAILSFLAVFREGAETVIFYEALLAMDTAENHIPVWWGALAATIALVVIFLIIRFTSVKIPYKQFFNVMSILVSVLVVIFAGSGLHELIEADVFDGIYMASWPTNDFLGLYPYVQTVVFQIVMAIIVIALYIVSTIRRKRATQLRAAAQN
ncbi:FTR1 family iron permease [Alloscardovia omnicolens]|uniref:FTR1 family iron permease n=1 Tax=Alloscardovia omnicolens TaxID=419015 RepID=UPI00254A7630|nr:FTR1 family protein [Alloscardovia omnicolens]MDK6522454.1 FTR1 family protein [Alloscardovia omnicolens]